MANTAGQWHALVGGYGDTTGQSHLLLVAVMQDHQQGRPEALSIGKVANMSDHPRPVALPLWPSPQASKQRLHLVWPSQHHPPERRAGGTLTTALVPLLALIRTLQLLALTLLPPPYPAPTQHVSSLTPFPPFSRIATRYDVP